MKYEPPAQIGLSEIEELMMPYWERPPEANWDLIDIVSEVVHAMKEPHRTIIQLVFYDRLSFSELAQELGIKAKSHAWRKTQRAIQEFKLAFENHPKIKTESTDMKKTWDENSMDSLMSHWAKSNPFINEFWRETDIANYLLGVQKDISKFVNGIVHGTHNASIDDLDEYMAVCGQVASGHLKETLKQDLNEIHELLCRKQRDYGHDNICMSGEIGLAVRMMDKIARLNNLLAREGKNIGNEPLVDTWIDILGYATVYHMYRAGTFTTPLKEMEKA